MMMDECMSNLTSASNVTSGNRDQQSQPPKRKRKRNQAGAEAEVIAMSPKSLLATNRFVCEVCNKGFQRDQNLQLHRRVHNLPWKLKQRKRNEVIRRKVYVCPEVTCVHHEASRALGDLTGIKKHFCRKHCEKKWKCDKCSKRYAVLSDWKAHSKICGTRQYKCDCGTLFSRRDSFITHRAFCDALAEERERSININSSSQQSHIQLNLQNQFHGSHSLPSLFPLKQEQDLQETFNISSNFFSSRLDQESMMQHQNSSNPTNNTLLISSFQPTKMSSPHMSATSLLQKATQMGVTMSKPVESIIRPHQLHMFTPTSGPSSFSESTNLGSTHIAFTESDTYSRGRPDTSQLFRRSSIPTFSEGSTQVALAESDSYLRGRFGTAELFRRSIIPRFGEGSTQGAPTRGIADTSEFIQRSSIPTLGETNNIAFAGSDSYSGGMFGTPELFQRGQSSTYLDTSIAGSSVGNFSAREEMGDGFIDGLASFGNKPFIKYSSCMGQVDPTGEASSSSLLHEMISSSFEEPLIFNGGQNFSGILSSKMNKNFQETLAKIPKEGENDEGLTRDFLGLTTAYPNSTRGQECLLMADLHHMGSSYEHQNHQN